MIEQIDSPSIEQIPSPSDYGLTSIITPENQQKILSAINNEECNFNEECNLGKLVDSVRGMIGKPTDDIGDIDDIGEAALTEILCALSTDGVTRAFALKDSDNQTFLHYAVAFKSLKLVDYILKFPEGRQALKIQTSYGDTPLHHAFLRDADDIIYRILETVEGQESEKIRNNDNRTPEDIYLNIAIEHAFGPQTEFDNIKKHLENPQMVGHILRTMTPEERKQALCIQDREGNTLLHLALGHCCEGDSEANKVLETLLEYEDDIQEALTTQNKDDETPLYLALFHNISYFTQLIDKEKKVLFLETKLEKSIIGLMCIYDKQSRCPFNEVVVRLTYDEIVNMMKVELNNGNYENALRIVTVAAKENMMAKSQEGLLINHCIKKHQEASTHGPEDSPSPVATVAPAALVVTSKPCVTVGTTLHAKAADLSTMGLYK
jgi:hypothetical protein